MRIDTTGISAVAVALDDANGIECQRFDRASIPQSKATRTAEGFLRVEGVPIARVGPQTYFNADGSARIELRVPEEVFAEDALKSGEGKPFVDEHPEPGEHPRRLVDISNSDRTVGAVYRFRADDARQYVLADLMVHDGATVREIEAGKRDLSAGYLFRPQPLKGRKFSQEGHALDGTEADLLQTSIRINHVALVAKGRANVGDPNGSVVRIRLDSAGNQSGPPGDPKESSMKLKKITIGGTEYEVPEAVAAAIDAADTGDAKGSAIENAALKAELANVRQDLTAAKATADKAEGSLAAANAEIATLKSDAEEAKKAAQDGAETPEARADHYELVAQVAKATETKPRDLVAKSTAELRRSLAEKLTGQALEGRSDEFVAGVLEQAKKAAEPNAAKQAAAANGKNVQTATDFADSPFVKAQKANRDHAYGRKES